jgi:hypothetical protein
MGTQTKRPQWLKKHGLRAHKIGDGKRNSMRHRHLQGKTQTLHTALVINQ